MACLTKDIILAAADLPKEKVDIPEWGGHAYIRCLTGKERERWELSMWDISDPQRRANIKNWRTTLVAYSLVDDAGNRIFGDKEIGSLAEKSSAVIDRLYDVCVRVSGLKQEDLDADIKNLEIDQN